ncbi:unnamed protein product [Rhizophagus irregularis]|nr:unnamed protein product [Rhizophagus irregularis]
MHSKIRTSISINASADYIIKQACVIDEFKETYQTRHRYPYTPSKLDFLTNKTSLFLLQHFHNLYQNQYRSHALDTKGKKKKPTGYYLATLDQQVDVKILPAGYHTGHPPKQDVCDACNTKLSGDSEILICGHDRLQNGSNELTEEEQEIDDNVEEE